MKTQVLSAVTFPPLNVVATIRRCPKCGAVVAVTRRPIRSPHTCPKPPAPAMALAA